MENLWGIRFAKQIENTLSESNLARRAGDGVICFIVAVIAEIVVKCGKLRIAIAGKV